MSIELIGADWREDPDRDKYAAGYVIVVSGPDIETREYPIYGVEGAIELELIVSHHLAIVNPFSQDDPTPIRVLDFTRGGRDGVRWTVQAIDAGRATVEIRSRYLKQAATEDPLDNAELAAMPIGSFNLDLVLDIAALDRNEWLPLQRSSFAPLAILPFFAVLSLFIGRWRRPSEVPHATTLGPTPVRMARVDAEIDKPTRDLGLVLSGGGTRASAFSLGVVVSLIEQGRYGTVGQIGSVSGGSLTNGYLAGVRHRLGRDPDNIDDVAQLATGIARRGLPLERSAVLFGASTVGAIGWIIFVLTQAAPSLAQAVSATVAISLLFSITSWLTYSWLGIRQAVNRWVPRFISVPDHMALGELGSTTGTGAAIDHIFTATAPGASHIHLSNRRSIIDPLPLAKAADPPATTETGDASGITIAKAVQASAAFPGLPHVRLQAADMGFSTVAGSLSLRDGGTVDNLGHIGATLDDRSADGADYRNALTEWDTIARWIVVDSSAEMHNRSRHGGWQSRVLEFLHLGFAADLAEIASTGAATTTYSRARQLIERFDEQRNGLYLHLRESPVAVCLEAMGLYEGAPVALFKAAEHARTAILGGSGIPSGFGSKDPRVRTAAELLQSLREAQPGDVSAVWAARAKRNVAVRTTLSGLGNQATTRLLHHGYVLATVKGALDFDWEVPTPIQLGESRFATLIGENPND